MLDFGLDPTYTGASDFTNPADVGNAVGYAVAAFALQDGWNQLGLEEGSSVNPMRFSDYTDFIPSNTGYKLRDITKWQPLLETNGYGYFQFQTHITAQARRGDKLYPYSMSAEKFFQKFTLKKKPYPSQSRFTDSDLQAYKAQADQVLAVSANLTDKQKMLAEFFDVKTK